MCDNDYVMKNAIYLVLLFQGGIANVFETSDPANVLRKDTRKDGTCKRIMQADFQTATVYVRGAAYAGANVVTASANVAGDAMLADWTVGKGEMPFKEQAHEVWAGRWSDDVRMLANGEIWQLREDGWHMVGVDVPLYSRVYAGPWEGDYSVCEREYFESYARTSQGMFERSQELGPVAAPRG